MSTNKNAIIRYLALDRCFRNPSKKYYKEDLVDACNEALLDVDPHSSGIQKRQLSYDIKFMIDSRGYNAPIETFIDNRKAYYRYSDLNFTISNQPINEQEANQIRETIVTLSRFTGMPQFEWISEIKAKLEQNFKLKTEQNVIGFEENPFLQGLDLINNCYEAIIYKRVLLVTYQSFKREDILIFDFHPYFLKQFNNRWFIFGLNNEYEEISNIPLDRIQSIEISHINYIENTVVDFDEYFEDIIGVTIPTNSDAEKVTLKVLKTLFPYIKSKPLHGSQKVKEISENYAIIELNLILNHELYSLLLSFGNELEILYPKQLREKIAKTILNLNNTYKSVY